MECDIFWEQITVEKYFTCSIYSTSEAGTARRAGIARIVLIDFQEFDSFIPEQSEIYSV